MSFRLQHIRIDNQTYGHSLVILSNENMCTFMAIQISASSIFSAQHKQEKGNEHFFM